MYHTPLPLANGWSFDWRSALIGAGAAWLIALVLYLRRDNVQVRLRQLWNPLARWQEQMRSSVADKYLTALQQTLQATLLFEPADPNAIFVPPTFLAPPALPSTLVEDIELTGQQPIAYSQILAGHPRLLLTGNRGQGRSTALALLVWQVAQSARETMSTAPYARFPLWIDLNQLTELPEDEELDPLEFLTALAVKFLPPARDKWLRKQLLSTPSVILIDNWEKVPSAKRAAVAHLITIAAQQLSESYWVIVTGQQGYAPLTVAGFVPVEIQPYNEEPTLHTIYTGWATLLEAVETKLEGSFLSTLQRALESGGTQLDFNLRTVLYLRTGQHPDRPVDVQQALLEELLPQPKLGEEELETAQEAKRITLEVLGELAWQLKTEEQAHFSPSDIESLLDMQLPLPDERPAHLERATRKLLQETELLCWGKELVTFRHYIWEDFFAARRCSQQAEMPSVLLEHLTDPDWIFAEEYYLGLGAAQALVKAQLQASLTASDQQALLTAARWAMLAPPEAQWRKVIMKVLARTFTQPTLTPANRIRLGRALTLIAGEGARPFFLQALRHHTPAVRAAALRGLGWTGTPKEMRILAGGLKDPDFATRESAVRALGDLGTPGALRLLQDQLPLVDEELMLVLAETLATNSKDGGEMLRQATESEDLLIRRAAVHGLGKIPAPWTKELLEHIQREDAQWLVRSAAEAALSTQESSSTNTATVLPPPQMDQSQWLINWAAEQGLGVGIGEAAMQILLRVLEKGEPAAQILAAASLAQIGQREHLTALQELLASPREKVQAAANYAINQIENRYAGLPPEE
ncbi:MAG: HEAT repeat domain-containing protein [Chloroflexota bacterium]|nr:HEAT repeat domain-containing protein [Chloroflexota bacterium]